MKELKSEGYIRQSGKGMSGYYLEVPLDQAEAFLEDNDKRILLQFKQGPAYHRALQKRKDGYALVTLSKDILKACGGQPGDRILFSIRPDTSKYGMAFPEEFEVTLEQDTDAAQAFDQLSPGRKRGVLHYIDSGKSVDTRVKRALEIAYKMKTQTLYGQNSDS